MCTSKKAIFARVNRRPVKAAIELPFFQPTLADLKWRSQNCPTLLDWFVRSLLRCAPCSIEGFVLIGGEGLGGKDKKRDQKGSAH